MIPNSVKAIILDFGNVVINIDVSLTFKTFAQISQKPVEQVQKLIADAKLFQRYETGLFETHEFREVVRQTLGYPLSDIEVDKGWNALLLEVPYQRITRVMDLQAVYPIYLLSNTNELHIKTCDGYFQQNYGIDSVRALFKKAFYSYELGLWKPDPKIYKFVLNDIEMAPEEVLFIDDNFDNIQAAEAMGIHCVHLKPGDDMLNHLKI